MAIRIPNLGTGNGSTGDNELKIRQDYNHNFSDQTNAASHLVGTEAGQIPLVENSGATAFKSHLGATLESNSSLTRLWDVPNGGSHYVGGTARYTDTGVSLNFANVISFKGLSNSGLQILHGYESHNQYDIYIRSRPEADAWLKIYHNKNTSIDSNGFLKGASPVVDMYDNKIDLNHDAEKQGVTLEKLGLGDYLIKGSLGFAQEGWYIETPKDANGNVLVAVVYEQLSNNDLSIKTYAKKFDDETGDIVANLLKPRDIPVGRFISLRLHELPKEPPVMPMDEPTTEV